MKNQIKSFFLFVAFCFLSTAGAAQPAQVTGLWLVEKVNADSQEMTPIAKWTRINTDGTFQSGNGWLQNGEGTWNYNSAKKSFLPKQNRGIIDPFGAFSVSFENGKMLWKREEEGMEVTVTWRQITKLPEAPADQVQGLWDLASATFDGQSNMEQLDPQNQQYLFLRWDRIYVERTSDGERATGYWHMNAHNPLITLMSHSSGSEPQSWAVKVSGDGNMVWTGNSDSNRGQQLTYQRLDQFPE